MSEDEPQSQTVHLDLIDQSPEVFKPKAHQHWDGLSATVAAAAYGVVGLIAAIIVGATSGFLPALLTAGVLAMVAFLAFGLWRDRTVRLVNRYLRYPGRPPR